MKKKYLSIGLPILGTLFCLWYIKIATCDIVYTDYIRLVNAYLPDVWNPQKFFVPDVLTRIPINYLGRIINTALFDYSTTVDMIWGVLGLGLAGWVIGCYCSHYSIRWYWLVSLMILLFGLNKWEMLTNGSGWPHFLAIACFYYHYLVLDRVWYGTEKKQDRLKLMVLPFVITLGIAGPYCAIYSLVMLLSYGFCMMVWARHTGKSDRRYLCYIICVILPFLCYLWSNSYAVEDHVGMQKLPLFATLWENPGYFARFFFNSLASDWMSGEQLLAWIGEGVISKQTVYLIGAVVLLAALAALWMNFRYHLYKTTMFPLMLLVTGGLNHLLILYSRWSFMNEAYGMSSRYALQFQCLTLGILLTAALAWEQVSGRVKRIAMGSCCVLLLLGSGMTTYQEVLKAPYREAYGERIAATALQYREVSDEVLRETFDYRKSREDSGAKVREALEILDLQQWNIFEEQ
ncbi:MAG: hypothetical protein RSF83_07530 [Hungatella sp.]